ncbi:MAG: hypothetical protein ACFCUR_04975 [Rhodomicrobiaceae bacterium]
MTLFVRRAVEASSGRSGRAVHALTSVAVAALALLAPVSEAEAAFRQAPDGGRIAVDLDDAFTPSDRFSGFVDKSTGASFAVIELPADAYDKLKTIPDSKEALANEGFGGTEKAELKARKGTFTYLAGEQKTPAGDVAKFVLMFTESDVTGVIVVNVPKTAIDAGAYSREGIEAILSTALVRDAADPNALFRFGYMGPFRKAFDHGGMTKAYNLSGSQPGGGENQLLKETMLMVSSSIHGEAIDVKAQANKSFMELGGMKERHINDEKEVEIGDLKGHQITGEVIDAESGDKIAIHLVLLSGKPFGTFMLLGSVPAAEKQKMMPEVEKVIASFELVK